MPCIITATFVMCGSAACNATKCGRSSGPGKKNLTPGQEQKVWGNSSTGTAIDADTKFCGTRRRSGCGSKSANSLILTSMELHERLQDVKSMGLSIGRLWLTLRQMGLRRKKHSTPRNKKRRNAASVNHNPDRPELGS